MFTLSICLLGKQPRVTIHEPQQPVIRSPPAPRDKQPSPPSVDRREQQQQSFIQQSLLRAAALPDFRQLQTTGRNNAQILLRLLRCLPHPRLHQRAQSPQQRPKSPPQCRRVLPTNRPREGPVRNRLHHLVLRRRGPVHARPAQRHAWPSRNARYARYARHARNARNARPSRLPTTTFRLPTAPRPGLPAALRLPDSRPARRAPATATAGDAPVSAGRLPAAAAVPGRNAAAPGWRCGDGWHDSAADDGRDAAVDARNDGAAARGRVESAAGAGRVCAPAWVWGAAEVGAMESGFCVCVCVWFLFAAIYFCGFREVSNGCSVP